MCLRLLVAHQNKYLRKIHHNNSITYIKTLHIVPDMSNESTVKYDIVMASGTSEEAIQCLEIYSPFVVDTTISFEFIPPTIDEFKERMVKYLESHPYLLAKDVNNGRIVGYAYSGKFSAREGYKYAAELAIYVAPSARKFGIAHQLYNALFDCLIELNIVNSYVNTE